MKSFVLRTSVLGLAALAAPVMIAGAQQVERAKTLEVSPYAGYMVFGKMFEGPVGTSLSMANGPIYGAQLGLALTKNVGVYGNIGYASSDLRVGVPILGGLNVGSTKTLMYDGGVELKLPLAEGSKVTPFAQGGVGAIRYDVESGFVNANATNIAYNFGGGFDVRLSPNFGLRLMAKDYIGKFDFEEATSFDINSKTTHNIGLTLGVNVGF